MDRLKLVEYLNIVFTLEKRCYEQEALLDDLQIKIKQYNRPYLQKEETISPEPVFWKYVLDEIGYEFWGKVFVVGIVISIIICGCSIYATISLGMETDSDLIIALLIGVIIGVVSCAPILIGFLSEVSSYRRSKQRADSENYLIRRKNSQVLKSNQILLNRYSDEFNLINNQYDATCKLLQKYYDLNVIYPKYRNISCIASILEYFLSGRCTTLTGHEGAYNILEQDLRFGAILTKLDVVIENLEEIKSNQNMLYTAIQECNASIGKTERMIENSAKQIMSNQSEAQSRLASIEYTNRVNSQNTQFLKNLAIYDHLTKKIK